MKIHNLFFLIFFAVIISCNSRQQESDNNSGPGKTEMAELNRYMVQKDRERIQNYIERKGLEMTESESGLWYSIISAGTGSGFKDNDMIIMDYECNLLDGSMCYSSQESGPKELIIGRSEMPAGLDQGLRLLKPGAEAIFIIPPFLGYGLKGDGNKIPPRSIIIFNVIVHQK